MKDCIMRVNIATYYPKEDRIFGALIWLPAFDEQIRDAKQQARADNSEASVTASIFDCDILPRIEYAPTLPTTVEELNYLAIRLSELDDRERIIYRALYQNYCRNLGDADVSVKDLINMTFNLDSVIMMPGIRNDEDLGHFVMANNLHPDVAAIPPTSLYLLDAKNIGKLQRLNEGGVIIDGNYVETSSYSKEEVYDGEHIPPAPSGYVFRFEICAPDSSDSEEKTMWITLPTDKEKVDQAVKEQLGVSRVEVCTLCDIESAIPQLSVSAIKNLFPFNTINLLASRYQAMTDEEQIKFKAILSAENIQDIYTAYHVMDDLSRYELAYMDGDAGNFFKSYLLHLLPEQFDRHWLDTLITSNEGEVLMERIGAKLTEYGVLSPKGGHLFDLAKSFYLEEAEYVEGQSYIEGPDAGLEECEKLDVAEVLGEPTLYPNDAMNLNKGDELAVKETQDTDSLYNDDDTQTMGGMEL